MMNLTLKLHRCRYEKREEIKVYHTQKIQDIHEKVAKAAEEMHFSKEVMENNRNMQFHTDTFTIKLERNAFGLYFVPITIHDKTYRFIIDTGAQISAILSSSSALQDAQKQDAIAVKSAGGVIKKLNSVKVNQLFLGSIEVKYHTFVVLNKQDFTLHFMKDAIMDFDGLIGWDILSCFDFEMDCQNGYFSKIVSKEYFTYCNLMSTIFPVVIAYDDHNMAAVFGIDSGAKVSWINENYARKANLQIVKTKRFLNMGVHGLEKMQSALVKECALSFYDCRIVLSNLRSGQTQVFANLHLDGIFGNEIFEKKRIQFLNSKGIVRILK